MLRHSLLSPHKKSIQLVIMFRSNFCVLTCNTCRRATAFLTSLLASTSPMAFTNTVLKHAFFFIFIYLSLFCKHCPTAARRVARNEVVCASFFFPLSFAQKTSPKTRSAAIPKTKIQLKNGVIHTSIGGKILF